MFPQFSKPVASDYVHSFNPPGGTGLVSSAGGAVSEPLARPTGPVMSSITLWTRRFNNVYTILCYSYVSNLIPINIYIYNNIYPKQIITTLITNAQNKYLWALKNIGLIFISVQYFQRATWAFSWTLLEKFLFGSFSKMILRVSQIPISKLNGNLNMMHTLWCMTS